MKYILTICLFFTSAIAFAQVDSVSLKEALSNLDKALINKDQKALVQLLHQDVSYGHSNGWVQNKTDIINDLKSGKLIYDKIENNSVTIAAINNKWATVRINTNAEGKVNGNSFQFKLHVLQVWLKAKSGWQLLARQSTKL
ncbi:MAG: nuclear transport factor 2 family protein [Bacteroidetes bacterium]|nr:MAG: nuclear transport factor 2 family protein [Bacteroidota bacterium]